MGMLFGRALSMCAATTMKTEMALRPSSDGMFRACILQNRYMADTGPQASRVFHPHDRTQLCHSKAVGAGQILIMKPVPIPDRTDAE